MSKAKKNDIIAVEETCSMTNLHSTTKTYEVLFLAQATRVDRQGIVQEFKKIGGTKTKIGPNYRVMTIEDAGKQALARILADKLEEKPTDNYYSTSRQLVDAINEQKSTYLMGA